MSTLVAQREAPLASPARFSPVFKAMHWVTPLLLIGAYGFAWSIDGADSREAATWLTMMHRSFGLLILLVTLGRLAWRQGSRLPALPADIPWPQQLAAKAVTVALYAMLLLQPLLGFIASQVHGDHLRVFGSFEIPLFLPTNRPVSRQLFAMHGIIALVLLAVISMHIVAALYHHFVKHDDVLRGMLPGTRRTTDPGL